MECAKDVIDDLALLEGLFTKGNAYLIDRDIGMFPSV